MCISRLIVLLYIKSYHYDLKIYHDTSDLDKIDWQLMEEKYWHWTPDDEDRPRRRQAEFLVHDYLPITSFLGLATFNKKMSKRVNDLLTDLEIELYVKVRNDWYY